MQFCGNNKIYRLLETLLSADNAPHTYIFSGPEFVGKKTLALHFLKALITKSERLELNTHSKIHPDIYCVSDLKDISAETARGIRSFLSHSPLAGARKGIMIDNAHLLGSVGSNILLKSLEEPPHQTFTTLITDRPDMLPNTITSRATSVMFTHASRKELLQLVHSTKATSISKELDWIAGRPGLLVEFIANPDSPHVTSRRKYFNRLLGENIATVMKTADDVSKENEPQTALEGILLNLWSRNAPPKKDAVAKFKAIIKAKEQIVKTNANIRLCVERALLS